MDKWVIRESTAKTRKGDSGEPNTKASGRLTSENLSTTTLATSTAEELNISVRNVTCGKYST
jgi:hypothetical protein